MSAGKFLNFNWKELKVFKTIDRNRTIGHLRINGGCIASFSLRIYMLLLVNPNGQKRLHSGEVHSCIHDATVNSDRQHECVRLSTPLMAAYTLLVCHPSLVNSLEGETQKDDYNYLVGYT